MNKIIFLLFVLLSTSVFADNHIDCDPVPIDPPVVVQNIPDKPKVNPLRLSLDASLGAQSKYVFRGIEFHKDWVAAPVVQLGYDLDREGTNSLFVRYEGMWSMTTEDNPYSNNVDKIKSGRAVEHAWTAGFNHNFNEDTSLALGVTYYDWTVWDGQSYTYEFFAKISHKLDNDITLHYNTYFDAGLAHGFYFEAGAEKSWSDVCTEGDTLTAGLWAGYADNSYYQDYYSPGFNESEPSFTNVALRTNYNIPIDKRWSVDLYGNADILTNHARSNGNKKENFTLGLRANFSF